MKIEPMGDRILLRILKIHEQGILKAGLVLPEGITISSSAGIAEIIGIGRGYLTDDKIDLGKQIWEPLEAKIGERIIFNARAGLALSKNYRIIRESEIIAKINEDGVDIGDELLCGDEN